MECVSDSDDFDSDDTLEILSDHTEIDVNNFLGQGIAIWLYAHMDSLTLFTPKPDDNMNQIAQYIQQKYGFNKDMEKFAILEAGEKTPKVIKDAHVINPGSVIMVLPKKNVSVNVEINQLDFTFPISADPLCTVFEVKTYIKRMKGIPIDQQDILYHDKVLENCRRLYEYRIRTGATLHTLIQVHFDILVSIETFWGRTYKMYIDRCTTGRDILYRVFSRTFSRNGKDHITVHELYVPVHILVFQYKKHSLHWGYCLGFYGVKNGDTLVLNTAGKKSGLGMQKLLVITELGENIEVSVSQFDRWSVVAFIMHGHTDVPVDLIRLYRREVQLDFTQVVGVVPNNSVIMMNIRMTNVDKDMVFGIPLKINIGNGIIENLKVVPSKTIQDVKQRLEEIGVPNATLYELGISQYKLPNHAKLKDVIKDFKKTLFLKVEKFPVFLHAPDGVIYKTNIDVNHCLKHLQQKIEMKSGHAISSCRLQMAGQEITMSDKTNLYDNGLSTRNSIFVQAAPMFETFFITIVQLLIKLRIPVKPSHNNIKRSIWANRDIPEGSITCLQTFFFWFFAPRTSHKYQLSKRRKRRKYLPPANEPLHTFSEREENPKQRKPKPAVGFSKRQPSKRNETKVYYNLPAIYRENSDEDARTWPLSLQRPLQPKGHVEDWINATYKDSKPERQHRRNPSRKPAYQPDRVSQQASPSSDRTHDKKRYYDLTPRWVKNLRTQDRRHVLVPDTNGTVYRSKDEKYPSYMDRWHQRKSYRKQHHQGDATNARFFNTKRMFDKQELLNPDDERYSPEGDSFQDLDDRSYVVLR